MDFVGAVGETEGAGVGPPGGEGKVGADAGGSVGLDGAVEDAEGEVRGDDFDGGDFRAGGFVADGIHHVGGLQSEQAGLFDFDAGLGDIDANRAHFREFLAEGDTRGDAATKEFEGSFGDADEAHAVMDAAGAEAALGDFEAAAFAEEEVFGGDTDVRERQFAVAVGTVVVAVDGEEAFELDAGGVEGDEDHGLLLVAGGGGVGFPHEDDDFAVGFAGAGGPPFAAVEDVMVAVAFDGGSDVGGVGGGDVGFGHAEDGADFAIEEGGKPLGLLGGGSVAMEDFHVAGIGGVAVEDFGGEGDAAHDFAQGGVFEIRQAGAVWAMGQEEVPEVGGAGFDLEFVEEGGGVVGLDGVDAFVHELLEARLPGEGVGGVGEVHRWVRQVGSGRWGVALKVWRCRSPEW